MHTLALRTKAGPSVLTQTQKTLSLPKHHSINRNVSTSPYGRTHVWKRRPPVLPNPVVSKFPQKVIRSDGTSFVQWTTSPKSLVRLTRDTANNPVWNMASWASVGGMEEESGSTGRLGRFSRRFGGATGSVKEREKVEVKEREDVVDLNVGGGRGMDMGGALDDVSWFEEMAGLTGGEGVVAGKGKKKEKK
ncbi:hypothetical protein P691DRAFT_809603 [Macrolepiota fuliginosa MF-IS2]|uniref:Uncharacterized protein n=1 Tax=Macrolepiota fuliginosa MF-IS2 TaxID=1400762 RepID=A0A9P5XGY7_9AGAR|nr:hypothetical protein P691DRAFT_809603 [Macrolepiota fuliginosa MF-IS2]